LHGSIGKVGQFGVNDSDRFNQNIIFGHLAAFYFLWNVAFGPNMFKYCRVLQMTLLKQDIYHGSTEDDLHPEHQNSHA
jgi:hypothetical protein